MILLHCLFSADTCLASSPCAAADLQWTLCILGDEEDKEGPNLPSPVAFHTGDRKRHG